jgi:hypothetical protein
MSQSGILNRGVYPPGTVVTKLTPSVGPNTPVVPDAANNINLSSGNNITTTGTGPNTIGFSLTGTTNHCIQIGNATGSLTSLAAATNGQIPIGSAGLDPVIATITATANTNITIIDGPGSITISGSTAPILDYVGVAFPAPPYTALVSNLFISCDVTGGVITIELPNAPTLGKYWIVKDRLGLSNTNNITVTTVGGTVLLDGATTFVINLAYGSNQFIFNGTSYEVF